MRFSIRYKFTIGLLIIFCICFNVMTIYINNMTLQNNKRIISNELVASQRDLNIYFKQYIIINNIKETSAEVEKNCDEIGTALASKLNNRILLYKKDGSLLLDTDYSAGQLYLNDGTIVKDDFSDLKEALKGGKQR
ncbi:hypothetical protein IAI10_04675 [Clostridium sp. 19966]|uniref:hypothetical protein n=1 Tax=Clostridium sp. 19966 TaxID=2768166 RepID=UPI0028DFD27B|nr:hypothetical protein [Clostridium sp. 19966]MDT8715939.1 hypothetical protein [Clostridium sp. 19966]